MPNGSISAGGPHEPTQPLGAEDDIRSIRRYRTLVGMSMDQLGLLIAASVLAGLGALLGIVFWLTNVAK
jgi:hypothetical protein